MTKFLVRVEATNFDTTIDDTNDLSTARGGSRACLLLPGAILRALATTAGRIRPVFAGASQAVGILESDHATRGDVESLLTDIIANRESIVARASTSDNQVGLHVEQDDEVEVLGRLAEHLTIIGVAVPLRAEGDDGEAYDAAARAAVARLRAKQLQRPTIDLDAPPESSLAKVCEKDGQRVARLVDRKGSTTLNISRSVGARRHAGRALRQTIYRRLLAHHGDLAASLPPFADSFEEIIARPPAGLPPALIGKMAVVHFDGNKFTQIRSRHRGEDGARRFAQVVERQREDTLAGLLANLLADPKMLSGDVLRFEVLLWGGDEATLVLPAWKARDALAHLADAFARPDWCIGQDSLTHAVAVLVCSHKMPIAAARSLSEAMVRANKQAFEPIGEAPARPLENVFSLQLLDSVEMPADSLVSVRETMYGSARANDYALYGRTKVDAMLAASDALCDPLSGVPRSQVYGLLARAGEFKRSTGESADPRLDKAIDATLARSLPGSLSATAADAAAAAWKAARRADLSSGHFGGAGRAASLLELKRLAELWEVLQPFPADLAAGAA